SNGARCTAKSSSTGSGTATQISTTLRISPPKAVESLVANWERLITFFDYPAEHWKASAHYQRHRVAVRTSCSTWPSFAGGASMALTCCRWCAVARSSSMEFRRFERKALLSQPTTNSGKPPDYVQPIHKHLTITRSPIRICGPAMPKFDHTLSDAREQISSG